MTTKSRNDLLPGAIPVLVLLVLSAFINYIDRGNLSVAAPLLTKDFGLSAAQLGLLFSSFFWTYATFQIISGWLADNFNVSWILALGFLLWSGATATTGLITSLPVLFIMRMILGAAESTAYPCFSKIFARHFPEQHRGFANALIASATSGGSAFGLLGGGMLMARIGWRPFFIGFGSLSLLWLIPWLHWMPRGTVIGSAENRPAAPGFIDLLQRKSVLGTCAGLFCHNYVSYFLVTWLPFYLVQERHFSMNAMAQLGGGVYLTAGVSAALSGWISDCWIAAGQTPTIVRKTFVAAGLISCGVFLVVCVMTGKSSNIVFLLLASVAFGLPNSNIWPITQTLAGPDEVGKWTGLQSCIGNMAGVVAPAVTGLIVDRTGHFLLAFIVTATVALLGSGIWLFVVGPVKPMAWGNDLGPPHHAI